MGTASGAYTYSTNSKKLLSSTNLWNSGDSVDGVIRNPSSVLGKIINDGFLLSQAELFRPNDFNKQTAIADKQGETELFFYHNKSAINTLSKEMHSSRGAAAKEIRKIQTETLNNVIKDSPFANKKINLLTIDVEGFEMNVLKGFDLEKYSPEVVVVEYIDPSMKKEEFYNQNINNIINSELYNFMKDRNYTFVNWLHTDLIFINNRIKD